MVLALPGVERYAPVNVWVEVTVSARLGLLSPATVALRLAEPAATPVASPEFERLTMLAAEVVHVETALPCASVVLQAVVEPSE